MAVRKEAKISAGEAYADGFRQGYKSRMGANADLPEIPVAPSGVLDHSASGHDAPLHPYLTGVAHGVAAGLKRKPV